jgi:cell division protein FtsB
MSRRIRKTRVVRERDPRSMRRLAFVFLLCAAAASLFLFSLWQRVELTGLHYQIEKLRAERDELLETQKQLRVKRSELRALPRVENIARRKLGLVSAKAPQLYAFDDSGRLVAAGAVSTASLR